MADDLDTQQQQAERGGEAGGDSGDSSFPPGGVSARDGAAGSVKGRPGVTGGGSSGSGSTGPLAGADAERMGVDPSPGPSGDGA